MSTTPFLNQQMMGGLDREDRLEEDVRRRHPRIFDGTASEAEIAAATTSDPRLSEFLGNMVMPKAQQPSMGVPTAQPQPTPTPDISQANFIDPYAQEAAEAPFMSGKDLGPTDPWVQESKAKMAGDVVDIAVSPFEYGGGVVGSGVQYPFRAAGMPLPEREEDYSFWRDALGSRPTDPDASFMQNFLDQFTRSGPAGATAFNLLSAAQPEERNPFKRSYEDVVEFERQLPFTDQLIRGGLFDIATGGIGKGLQGTELGMKLLGQSPDVLRSGRDFVGETLAKGAPYQQDFLRMGEGLENVGEAIGTGIRGLKEALTIPTVTAAGPEAIGTPQQLLNMVVVENKRIASLGGVKEADHYDVVAQQVEDLKAMVDNRGLDEGQASPRLVQLIDSDGNTAGFDFQQARTTVGTYIKEVDEDDFDAGDLDFLKGTLENFDSIKRGQFRKGDEGLDEYEFAREMAWVGDANTDGVLEALDTLKITRPQEVVPARRKAVPKRTREALQKDYGDDYDDLLERGLLHSDTGTPLGVRAAREKIEADQWTRYEAEVTGTPAAARVDQPVTPDVTPVSLADEGMNVRQGEADSLLNDLKTSIKPGARGLVSYDRPQVLRLASRLTRMAEDSDNVSDLRGAVDEYNGLIQRRQGGGAVANQDQLEEQAWSAIIQSINDLENVRATPGVGAQPDAVLRGTAEPTLEEQGLAFVGVQDPVDVAKKRPHPVASKVLRDHYGEERYNQLLNQGAFHDTAGKPITARAARERVASEGVADTAVVPDKVPPGTAVDEAFDPYETPKYIPSPEELQARYDARQAEAARVAKQKADLDELHAPAEKGEVIDFEANPNFEIRYDNIVRVANPRDWRDPASVADVDNYVRDEIRDIIVVNVPNHGKQAFYRSTGRNSNMPGEWLPFDGITSQSGSHYWFNKGRFAGENTPWGNLYDVNNPLHRFGNSDIKAMSQKLNELDIEKSYKADGSGRMGQGQYLSPEEINIWIDTPESLNSNKMLAMMTSDAKVAGKGMLGQPLRRVGKERPSKPPGYKRTPEPGEQQARTAAERRLVSENVPVGLERLPVSSFKVARVEGTKSPDVVQYVAADPDNPLQVVLYEIPWTKDNIAMIRQMDRKGVARIINDPSLERGLRSKQVIKDNTGRMGLISDAERLLDAGMYMQQRLYKAAGKAIPQRIPLHKALSAFARRESDRAERRLLVREGEPGIADPTPDLVITDEGDGPIRTVVDDGADITDDVPPVIDDVGQVTDDALPVVDDAGEIADDAGVVRVPDEPADIVGAPRAGDEGGPVPPDGGDAMPAAGDSWEDSFKPDNKPTVSIPKSPWKDWREWINLPRSLLSTGEISAILRQGALLAPRHPKTWGRAVRESLSSLWDEADAQKLDTAMRTSPAYKRFVMGESPAEDVAYAKEQIEKFIGSRKGPYVFAVGGPLERGARYTDDVIITNLDEALELANRGATTGEPGQSYVYLIQRDRWEDAKQLDAAGVDDLRVNLDPEDRRFGQPGVQISKLVDVRRRHTGKLFFAEQQADFAKREEVFANQLAQKIPGLGKIVRGSERQYVNFLNKLRLDVMDDIVRGWEKGGKVVRQDEIDDLARFINHATGRGDLGKLEAMAPVLNAAFFSPRLAISRPQVILDVMRTYRPGRDKWSRNVRMRRQLSEEVIAYAVAGTTILTLLGAAGAKVGWDHRGSDFGKVRIGKTEYDFWAGYQPIMRSAFEIIHRESVSRDDKVSPKDWGETTQRFFRSKLSPPAGIIADVYTGKDFLGNPMSKEADDLLMYSLKRVTPLFYQDMIEAFAEEGILGGVKAAPGAVGIGTATFSTFEEEIKERAKAEFGVEDRVWPFEEAKLAKAVRDASGKVPSPFGQRLNELEAEETDAYDNLSSQSGLDKREVSNRFFQLRNEYATRRSEAFLNLMPGGGQELTLEEVQNIEDPYDRAMAERSLFYQSVPPGMFGSEQYQRVLAQWERKWAKDGPDVIQYIRANTYTTEIPRAILSKLPAKTQLRYRQAEAARNVRRRQYTK